jgi:hypothetical protein
VQQTQGGSAMHWPAALVLTALIVLVGFLFCCPTCSAVRLPSDWFTAAAATADDGKSCTRERYVGKTAEGIPFYQLDC